MSKNVIAVIATTPFQAEAGTIAGNFRVALVRAGDTSTVLQSIDTADLTVTFQNLDAGDYQVAAVRLDVNGVVVGTAAVSDAFTIADEAAPATVSIDVPASVTVTIA